MHFFRIHALCMVAKLPSATADAAESDAEMEENMSVGGRVAFTSIAAAADREATAVAAAWYHTCLEREAPGASADENSDLMQKINHKDCACDVGSGSLTQC